MIAASGDDVFIAEHRPLFPQTRFVQTKRATRATSGISAAFIAVELVRSYSRGSGLSW